MFFDDLEEAGAHCRKWYLDGTPAPLLCYVSRLMPAIRATTRYARALTAITELLEKLRIDAIFVGNVARAAWLDGELSSGAIDLLALMNTPQRGQLAMMASNRGFRVSREEIEQSEELDLVPLNFSDVEGDVRVHVLLATNALYARMFANGKPATLGEVEVRVASPEDLALMLLMAEDQETLNRLAALPEFDRDKFRAHLASIGLGAPA